MIGSEAARVHGVDPGLCGSCAHSRIVVSGRGSRFFLCGLSTVDPRFPRYPPLPVLACFGWKPATAEGDPPDP